MRLPPFAREFLLLFGGPIVWAAHFLAIYTFAGVVCAVAPQPPQWLGVGLLTWGVLGLGALALVPLALLLMHTQRRALARAGSFVPFVSSGLAWLSLLAIALETVTVFIVPVCTTVA